MKKSLAILCLILATLLFVQANSYMGDLREQDAIIAQLQQPKAIDKPYTMITNLCSSMYINSVTIPSDALKWTDVNGVSGFDITVGTTHYRYVEGHIMGSQLYLYAPYINIIDDELLFE